MRKPHDAAADPDDPGRLGLLKDGVVLPSQCRTRDGNGGTRHQARNEQGVMLGFGERLDPRSQESAEILRDGKGFPWLGFLPFGLQGADDLECEQRVSFRRCVHAKQQRIGDLAVRGPTNNRGQRGYR